MTTSNLNSTPIQRLLGKPLVVFMAFWVVLFVLYLPAASAGRVGDFPGWVYFLTTHSFTDYINRTDSGIPSMYQFTQVVTFGFYKLFGANAWLWHLLFISMQAVNAFLLFTFFRRLFASSAVENAGMVAFCGAMLFCVCPHISEVVVWEPAFHYLLALMLMLAVLRCMQLYVANQKVRYAVYGGLFFMLSTFSLELFYLTPVFCSTLLIFYRLSAGANKKTVNRTFLYFMLPQVAFFALHFALLYTCYHGGVAHITAASLEVNAANLSKAPKYLFHLLFFGRFFPAAMRAGIYQFCGSAIGLAACYSIVGVALLLILFKLRAMSVKARVRALLFVWVVASLGLLLPLWFQEAGLVIYDRYSYLLCAFLYMFVALLFFALLPKYISLVIVSLFALLNIRFTHKVNAYWQQSAHIVNNLVSTFPNDPAKKVLLLNLPECLDGVQMVGTRDDGEFRMMYNAIMPQKVTNDVYDVEAFYMRGPNDGAHVMVVNDSTIRVTLNQWGTWWLYYGFGAASYENKDYRVDMRDVGHWYDLVLKHPSGEYLLLYTAGSDWKKVDLSKKNVEQD